jgi:hypothetical protein
MRPAGEAARKMGAAHEIGFQKRDKAVRIAAVNSREVVKRWFISSDQAEGEAEATLAGGWQGD